MDKLEEKLRIIKMFGYCLSKRDILLESVGIKGKGICDMRSIWEEGAKREENPALTKHVQTDVLVIGGGMCGILTAYFLKRAGVQVLLVEKGQVGSGVTKHTTAKITAQHGLIYADLIRRFGIERARQYYDANTRAIKQYRDLAQMFPCDFQRQAAYVYSEHHEKKLEEEQKAYERLEISTKLIESLKLPFATVSAIEMKAQAQFHPLKLLYALADTLDIYENTPVLQIRGNLARTPQGSVCAKYIILATHYPLVNIPGLYFLKLYQDRSYVKAFSHAPFPDGMYIDAEKGGFSFRSYQGMLLIGGGAHKTGTCGGGYAAIDHFAEKVYPQAKLEYAWATQDCMPLDKLPYIGRHRLGSGKLFVATGFHKWGMTSSMLAAEKLTNLVLEKGEDTLQSLKPQRSMLCKQLCLNIGSAVKGLFSAGGPRCSHMGCKLQKNTEESTWDCPCHGSRFTEDGQVIENPAKREIRI